MKRNVIILNVNSEGDGAANTSPTDESNGGCFHMVNIPRYLSVDNLPTPDAYETMSVDDLRRIRSKIPPSDMADCPGDDQIYRLHMGIICDAIDIKLNERNIALRQSRIDDAIAMLSLLTGTAI